VEYAHAGKPIRALVLGLIRKTEGRGWQAHKKQVCMKSVLNSFRLPVSKAIPFCKFVDPPECFGQE